MKDIKNRVLQVSEYVICTNKTIRETAKEYNVSKSTIHKDLSERLIKYDFERYLLVKEILIKHDKEKHINGGLSTKLKYESNYY